MNILYLVNCKYVRTKMSRVRFHSIEALSKICNLTIWGIGFPNYNNNLSVIDNINNLKTKFNCVISYKPLVMKNFEEIPITKIKMPLRIIPCAAWNKHN